eukprot:3035178-Rhodomonas_salina.1
MGGTSADFIGNANLPSKINLVAIPMSGSLCNHVAAREAIRDTSNAGISRTVAGDASSASS